MDQEQKAKHERACKTAEDFVKLYYECLDKKRQVLSKYYLSTGILIWNGNAVSGRDAIHVFFTDYPPSEHVICTLDAQPVHDLAVDGNTTITLLVTGTVKLGENKATPFTQDFMITAEGDKWKIVSDTFRFQEDWRIQT